MVRNITFRLTFLAVLMCLIFVSCGQDSIVQRVEKEYKNENFKQVVFLVKHNFSKGGPRNPHLLFITAESLLLLGIESEAEDYFAEIYSSDSTWAPKIASVLQNRAIEYMNKGAVAGGRRFIIQAVNYNPNITFGEYDLEAGKLLMEKRDFNEAIVFFKQYIDNYPDSSGAAGAMLNLGLAYQEAGFNRKAIDIYRFLVMKYPVSRFVSTASWNYENLSIEEAKRAFEGNELEIAENILLPLTNSSENTLNLVRANFMLGEIFSRQKFVQKSIDCYKKVLRLNLGSSGRYTERAKERIEKLEESK
ncbi:tetratricopeptide repeat protein [bacterium]|nr:tetratricopeptide repeat protein [bacterium]